VATPEEQARAIGGQPEPPDTPPSAGTSVQAGARRIEDIIEQAQQSARQFIDNAKQQSELMLAEAQQEARTRRADVIGNARQQVDGLVGTAEEMLRGVGELNSRLNDVVTRLRTSSERLQAHIDALLAEDEAASAARRRLGGRR
jgi:hypothetical protein